MEERVDRLELSVDRTVERDDDSGDRPRSQRDANEMTRRERETFWHDVAECSCRTAEPGENGDLGGQNNSRLHIDISLRGGRLELDDEPIVEDGRFLAAELG